MDASRKIDAPLAVYGGGDSDCNEYLIGVRGYITEHWEYADEGVVEGVELLYSNGTSTKCGECSSTEVTEIIAFEQGEHIIGIDFEQDSEGVTRLTLYTSRSEGRSVDIWKTTMGEWVAGEQRAPYIGVYDSKLSEAGRKFTCRRGRRVADIKFDGQTICRMITEKIPEGENEKWWEKSLGFKPRAKKTAKDSSAQSKKPKVAASASVDKEVDESPYLAGVKASYKTKDGKDYIVGLELRYSNGQSDQWGKVLKTKMSAELPFGKDGKEEHIVGINFDCGYYDDGIESIDLYTSNFGGRAACFSIGYGGVEAHEDGGCYVGVYGHEKCSLSPKGKKFTCQQGNRVTGITFKNNTITSMSQDDIPKGHNEKWYQRSMGQRSDRTSKKPKKRQSNAKPNKAKKAKRSGSTAPSNPPAFDQERHNRIMAQVERQSYLMMNDPDYEPEYDSEGNYHPYEGGMTSSHYSTNRTRSRYGYEGGCCGFNSRDCDDLLDQGIKPWEDDAYGALGAMRGW